MKEKNKKVKFIELYQSYFSALVCFAQEYVMIKEDAENIVQDMFLQLYERQETLESINNIHSYLFVLIKNRCIDYLRHEKQLRNRTISVDSVNSLEIQLKLEALVKFDDDMLMIEEMKELLCQSINQLPEKRRHIFLLSRINHLSHKKIAEKLHLSVSTIQNQIGLALRQIRKDLNEYFTPPPLYKLYYCIFYTN